MKKVIIYFLCTALLVTALSSPAYATSDTINGVQYIDLLEGSDLYWGSSRGNYPYEYTGYDLVSSVRAYYNWTPPDVNYNITSIYVTVCCNSDMQPMILYTSGTSAAYYGTLTGRNGIYHEYKFTGFTTIDDLTLTFRFDSSAYRYLSICSVIGFGTIYEGVQAFNFYQYWNYIWSPDGVPTLTRDLYNTTIGAGTPFVSTHTEYPGSTTWYEDQIYIDIPEGNRNQKLYKRLNVLFDYVGSASAVGASLYAAGASVPNVILDPKDIGLFSFTENPATQVSSAEWTLASALITVDLEGIDLTGYTLDVNFNIEPVSAGTGGDKLTYVRIRSIWFDPLVTEEAWYVRFWHWMSGGLKDLGSSITDKLEQLLGDSDDPALEEGGQAIQEDAQDAASDQAVLDTVTRPEVNADQLVDQYTNFDTSSISVLTALTGNNIVGTLITLSVTFGLIGFVFYGKKG